MREDEAKKKWCPMTRNIQLVAWGRSGDSYADLKSNCIASDCMAWKWNRDENGQYIMTQTDESWTCPYCNGTGKSEDYGYCPECEGQGKGFKQARTGDCGLKR